jgi:hypothetical protein
MTKFKAKEMNSFTAIMVPNENQVWKIISENFANHSIPTVGVFDIINVSKMHNQIDIFSLDEFQDFLFFGKQEEEEECFVVIFD